MVSNASEATTLVSDDAGKVTFSGIDEGTYKLLETESPIGYNKLDEPVSVTIKNTPSTKAGDAQRYLSKVQINGSSNELQIENQTGGIFPGTGGPGAFLIAGAGVLFVMLGMFVSVLVWKQSRRHMHDANQEAMTWW